MKFLLISAFLISGQVLSNEKTDKQWASQLAEQGLDSSEQSYCYTNEKGEVEGKNIDMKIRLASTSKLLVSLWAVEKLGVNHRYDLKVFIKGNRLHLQGSFDPYLGNEKMFYLLSQLNERGYNKFENITFDKNTIVFPDVQYSIDEYPSISPASVTRYLKNYFNTKSWSEDTKAEYKNFREFSKTGRFIENVSFEAPNVQYSDKNPLENDSEAVQLTLTSPPLYKYAKEMNIKSNNFMAETFFRQLGGSLKFEQYLSEKFNLTNEKIHFYTGSGLPYIVDGVRKDNYASCSIMTKMIQQLKKVVEDQKMELEDIVAVPGSDGGTFKNRIFPSDFKNSFVAKTGTLMHTSTLAGAMNTQSGFSFFGVFNQSNDISGSKIVQNNMVKSIMNELGGPRYFDYTAERFNPYANEILKDFEFQEEFSSINGLLQ